MKDNTTPFPGKPRLPKMTVDERKLWAASHNLPEGILLLYEAEVQRIYQSAQAIAGDLQRWRTLGRVMLGTEDPLAAYDRLVERKKEHTSALEAAKEEARVLRAELQGGHAP